jgi:phosphate starvation-inducible PhoH-like protein
MKAQKDQKSDRKGREIKEKFQEERNNPPPIQPRSEKQAHYLAILRTEHKIIAEGLPGTGKSFCAASIAADKLRRGEINKIIVARPYVQTGRTAGFRPGSTLEKLYPYVRNALDTIEARLGTGMFKNALKDGLHGQIEVQALEDIRGRSFDEPSFLIIEEAQQTTPQEMLSIVTRCSDLCTLVISGDDGQRDIHGGSGLAWFKEFAVRHNLPDVGFVDFNDPDKDIIRGGGVREIMKGIEKDKANGIYVH